MMYHDIIKRPLITEKTTTQKAVSNQLSFEVDRRANRVEIKKAIDANKGQSKTAGTDSR